MIWANETLVVTCVSMTFSLARFLAHDNSPAPAHTAEQVKGISPSPCGTSITCSCTFKWEKYTSKMLLKGDWLEVSSLCEPASAETVPTSFSSRRISALAPLANWLRKSTKLEQWWASNFLAFPTIKPLIFCRTGAPLGHTLKTFCIAVSLLKFCRKATCAGRMATYAGKNSNIQQFNDLILKDFDSNSLETYPHHPTPVPIPSFCLGTRAGFINEFGAKPVGFSKTCTTKGKAALKEA